MSLFETYLLVGFRHIIDWNGYDHILFIFAVCAPFQLPDWRKIVGLITAFTVGHSLSLALAVTNIILLKSSYIEICIPLTIIFSSLINLQVHQKQLFWGNYALISFFGFVHGFGFSYLLKMLLGKENEIFLPLLAFNLGLEIGQVCIVLFFFLVLLFLTFLRIKPQYCKICILLTTTVVAFILLFQRLWEV